MFGEKQDKLSLMNIGEGLVIQKFDEALEMVFKDILNPNTSEKFRTITITAKIGPINDSRNLIGVDVASPNIKFPTGKSFTTSATLTLDSTGKPVAKEIPKQQMPIPFGTKVVEGGFQQKT